MRVIVAGSRSITDPKVTLAAIAASGFTITEIVCGEAAGPDTHGRIWAMERNVPVASFPADWTLGLHAGFLRNEEMATHADALIAVWDGRSRGTADMIKRARIHGLAVYIHDLF